MANPSLRQRLRYAFDNTMARGTSALVFWLVVATAVLIVFFSSIVLIAGLAPKGDHHGVIGQLFRSLLHAMDPGTVAGDAGKWPFLLVMLLLTIGGLLIVSALIGVLATGLDRKLDELRKGRSVVLERDHTLILGWSETIFTILAELEVANASEKNPSVVILADHDRVQMEDAIRAKLRGGIQSTRVVCRSGSPVDLADLQVASPQTARSVIVLSPENDPDPDSQVIKTILALTRSPGRREHAYRIVAEIHDPTNMEAARLVGGDEAVLVDKRETISRLLVQSSRQSGASVVYNELLDFEGDELYFRSDERLAGLTFGDALFAYDDCSVIGLRLGGSVLLNPHPDLPVDAGTELIAIAEDDARLAAAAPFAGEIEGDAIVAEPPTPDAPTRVLILGWNSRTPSVIAEFDKYLAPGSQVKVVADWAPARDVIARESGELSNAELAFEVGNTTDRRTLDSLGIESYRHVVVMCYSEQLDHQRADARTLVTLLHLRDIAARADARLTITSEMLDDRNRELAQVTKVDDVIVSDRVLSLMLTQLSENENLAAVFSELFAAEGSEIYLRPAAGYVQLGRELSYATVVEAARRRREVAVGYRLGQGEDDPSPGGFAINPAKSTRVRFDEDDRVIVLAEH
ncbi:MAG: CASTOR/POLLUX-related putative ion channel [Thermoleophilaceae bacterium]